MTFVPTPTEKQIQGAYDMARERYGEFGIDTDQAVARARDVPVSLHCWQTDDVSGLADKGRGVNLWCVTVQISNHRRSVAQTALLF